MMLFKLPISWALVPALTGGLRESWEGLAHLWIPTTMPAVEKGSTFQCLLNGG